MEYLDKVHVHTYLIQPYYNLSIRPEKLGWRPSPLSCMWLVKKWHRQLAKTKAATTRT